MRKIYKWVKKLESMTQPNPFSAPRDYSRNTAWHPDAKSAVLICAILGIPSLVGIVGSHYDSKNNDSLRAQVTCEKYDGPVVVRYDPEVGIVRKADFRCVAKGDRMTVEGYVQSPSDEERVTGEPNPKCNSEDLNKIVDRDTYLIVPKSGTRNRMREVGLRPRDGHLIRSKVRRATNF